MNERAYDIVLFGATGFTGRLTAEYLAAHAPAGLRWALAGRSGDRLRALRDQLGISAEVVTADAGDSRALRELAGSTRLVATTVGPFIRYGGPLVAACAEAGTDYVDLTGESEFVDRVYVEHHATAARTGARLVHACGFDSIPPDLGAAFTVRQLPEGEPIRMRGYISAGGRPSGGTFNTVLLVFGSHRSATAAHAARRAVEPTLSGSSGLSGASVRKVRGAAGRPHRQPALGLYGLPMASIDPQIVLRSARALGRYGPDFTYGHFIGVRSPLTAAGIAAGMGATFAAAQIGPARRALGRLLPPGKGPTEERRSRSWFRMRFVAESGDQRVLTEVAGGDPGYGETAKMLAESALCLTHDDLPAQAGQLTTAVAMGDALQTRLEKAGLTFRVIP